MITNKLHHVNHGIWNWRLFSWFVLFGIFRNQSQHKHGSRKPLSHSNIYTFKANSIPQFTISSGFCLLFISNSQNRFFTTFKPWARLDMRRFLMLSFPILHTQTISSLCILYVPYTTPAKQILTAWWRFKGDLSMIMRWLPLGLPKTNIISSDSNNIN